MPIVDDDSAVQATVKPLFERPGRQVAGDGCEALDMLATGDFELLLLDIQMPGMDGLESMRLINRQHPLLTIVVISGRRKPFKPSALLAAMSRGLEAATPHCRRRP